MKNVRILTSVRTKINVFILNLHVPLIQINFFTNLALILFRRVGRGELTTYFKNVNILTALVNLAFADLQ